MTVRVDRHHQLCYSCKEILPSESFSPSASNDARGTRSICKTCDRERARAYRARVKARRAAEAGS